MTSKPAGVPMHDDQPGWSEAERLAALQRYAILDSGPEQLFDELVELAAEVCAAPIALISFVADGRQWFKAETGLGASELPLNASICPYAFLQPGLFVVPDLSRDPRFEANPYVSKEGGWRFYAGALLETPEGMPLGTVCVLDNKPRPGGLAERQGRILQSLARQVMSELELRRTVAQRDRDLARLEEKRAKLDEARRLLDAVVDAMPVGVIIADAQGRIIRDNAANRELWGVPPETDSWEGYGDWVGFHADTGERIKADEWAMARALLKGETVRGELVRNQQFRTGDQRFFLNNAAPVRGPGGDIIGGVVAELDVTDRLATEQALRESEAMLRAFFDTRGLFASVVELRDDEVVLIAANQALRRLLGRHDIAGLSAREVMGDEGAAELLAFLRHVDEDGGSVSTEHAFATPQGKLWLAATVSPLPASADGHRRFSTASINITKRKRAEEHQRLLIGELNHRVKNTLAIVQAIAHQSFGRSGDQQARASFEARLTALARANDLLTREEWQEAKLYEVVEQAILSTFGATRERFDIAGPDVTLPPKAAVSVAMALHELCTNAIKYGALSNEHGRVDVRWEVAANEEARLQLVWREQDGPSVTLPTKRGFGSRLIERGLAVELGGTVRIDYLSEGVVCTIDAALTAQDPGVGLP